MRQALCRFHYFRDGSIGCALIILTFGLYNEIFNFGEFWTSAITVQSQNSEIFQVGKRNIINQKMIDKWGNANIALPRPF
jgi:hypothetical protein